MKAKLTLETAKQLYKEGGAGRAFALDNYPEEKLTEPKYPESWEELVNVYGYFATEAQAEASIALAQLTQLMKVYMDGVELDWGSDNLKYTIEYRRYFITTSIAFAFPHLLTFDTREKRDHFLKHHIDLIKQAAPLLWGVEVED